MSILQMQFPFGAGWRLETGSLLIGLVLGILLTVLARRLWPILRRWQQRAAGRVRQLLAWMRSGIEVRFQSETVEYVQRYHLGQAWANLDQIYVAPRLVVSQPEVSGALPADWGASQLVYLWPELSAGIATPMPRSISVRDLLINGQRSIISGGPGSGKSTLLAYCTYLCASAAADGDDANLLPTIPVFIHLSELALPGLSGGEVAPEQAEADPFVLLLTALQKRSSSLTAPGIKGLLEQKFAADNILLLIDGWDELAAGQRSDAIQWLAQLLKAYPGTQVIAAASLQGYGPLLSLDFTLTGILPWDRGQVERFAGQWTKAFPLSQSPKRSYYWQPGQSNLEISLRFWALALPEKLQAQERGLPGRLTELMRQSIDWFTPDGEKREDDAPESGGPGDALLSFWQQFAFVLVSEERLSLTQAEIGAVIGETLARHNAVDRGEATRLQKSLSKSGLFKTWGNDTVGFATKSWRDFLAACHMAKEGIDEPITAHLNDPNWAPVLRFYVGLVGATELAAQLLAGKERSHTRDSLFQVASWMPEAPDGGEWRRQTMILLGQIIRQSSFAFVLRQRAVAALVQTREPGVFTFVSQLLERSDPFLRQIGTAALSQLGADKAIDLLSKMLSDGDSQVRQTAVNALVWMDHPDTERPLLIALIQGDDEMGRVAAQGLTQRGSEGMEILKEAVEDDDVRVRRSAIYGLALLDEPWVLPLLTKIERGDSQWLVKTAAEEGIAMLNRRHKLPPWQPIPVSQQQWLLKHAAQEGRVVPKGKATLPFLVQILTESTLPNLRLAAAASLGQLAAKEVLPAVETAVRDEDTQVGEAAFISYCQILRAHGVASSAETEG